ncbi:MAG: ABC transporter permease [Ruthenibacterium sp.]
MKKRRIAAMGLLFACLLFAFGAAKKIQRIYPVISLRYDAAAPLTRKNVTDALTFALDESNSNALYPTFWRETKEEVIANQKKEKATVLYFIGSGADCYAAEFVAGGYPGDMDANGCALSTQAAWKLFGSNDIIGQELTNHKKTFVVRGVFQESQSVCLAGADKNTLFAAMELSGTNTADRRAQALSFVQKTGLPMPAQMVYGPSIAALAQMLCAVPLFLAALYVLCAAWRQSKMLSAPKRQFYCFLAALFCALLLPFLLTQIPAWLLPPRWSDFSFWTALHATIKERMTEWFALVPCAKDVQVKISLLQTAGCSTLAAGIVLYLLSAHKKGTS